MNRRQLNIGEHSLRTVNATYAKRHFAELLRDIVEEKEIGITRHGVPVARLVALPPAKSQQDVAKAIEEWIAYRKAHNITLGEGVTIRDLIEEGRRF